MITFLPLIFQELSFQFLFFIFLTLSDIASQFKKKNIELTSSLRKMKHLILCFNPPTQKIFKFSLTFFSVFQKFNSVEDIIEHYKYFPIVLIDGKDKTGIHREQCYLTQPLPLSRCFSPW